jgi:hypothetical protein
MPTTGQQQATNRWNINGADAAAIFSAIHNGVITIDPERTSVTHLAPLVDNWVRSNPSLERKYRGPYFRNNIGKNFRNVVKRYERWVREPSKCHAFGWYAVMISRHSQHIHCFMTTASGGRVPAHFLELANVDIPERNEDRIRGFDDQPGSDNGDDDQSLSIIGDDGDNNNEDDDIDVNSDDDRTTGEDSPNDDEFAQDFQLVSTMHLLVVLLRFDFLRLLVKALAIADKKLDKMYIDSFSGPNFVTDVHDGGLLQLTQKSVGIFVFLPAGMDISTLKHKIVIVPKKHAQISVEVKLHANMLDPFLLTPMESAGCEEFINSVRVYLQERQRKGAHVIKVETTINGDFEEGLVQPTRQTPGGPCQYKAMPSHLSPFRISNVGGTNANHSQGVVLSTLLLCKLHRDMISALQTPEYAMPVMMATRSPGLFSSPPPSQHSPNDAPRGRPQHSSYDYVPRGQSAAAYQSRPNPTPGVSSFAGPTSFVNEVPRDIPQNPASARRPAGNLKDDRQYGDAPYANSSFVGANTYAVTTVEEDMDEDEEQERRLTPVKRVRQSRRF